MIPYWSAAMLLDYLFRFYGLEQTPGIEVDQLPPFIEGRNLIFIRVGIVAAFVYTLVEAIGDISFIQKRPFGQILFIKIGFAFSLILINSYIISRLVAPFELDTSNNILSFKPFWSLLFYFTFMSALASFLRLMVHKIGKGPFIRLILGKYRKPKQERRVFLFLDLKSSVMYAQKLGHLAYSQLIQECFYDLDRSVNKYKGEIYQYVGDEAVVTWPYEVALSEDKCVACFLNFRERLRQRSDFYFDKFQFLPEFKAGLHGGSLTVAEVGAEKKEIAYHGDVINTASRIQEVCNRLNEKFLISSKLASELSAVKYKSLGPVELKGRDAPIELVAIEIE